MITPTHTAYLLLGSNLGDRIAFLAMARKEIEELGTILTSSHLYMTKSWGDVNQPDHINQVLKFKTNIRALDLMTEVLKIEERMGRVRSSTWQPRVIDIDILFFDTEVHSSPFLTLPHNRIPERNFVLIPMMEIAADLKHPSLHKTIEELYLSCEDHLEVLMLEYHG